MSTFSIPRVRKERNPRITACVITWLTETAKYHEAMPDRNIVILPHRSRREVYLEYIEDVRLEQLQGAAESLCVYGVLSIAFAFVPQTLETCNCFSAPRTTS